MTSPTLFIKKVKIHHQSWKTVFALGSFFGFFVASTISAILFISTPSFLQSDGNDYYSYHHSEAITTHALRALASIRHFPETNGWGLVHVFVGNNNNNEISHLSLPNDQHRQSSSSSLSSNKNKSSRKGKQKKLPHGGVVGFGGGDNNNNEYHDDDDDDVDDWWWSVGRLYQDYLVSEICNGKQNGFFVDVGAGRHDGPYESSSNTYALENHYGWNGICIESNSQYWESLSLFRRCDIVGAILGQDRMQDITAAAAATKELSAATTTTTAAAATKDLVDSIGSSRLHSTVTLREILERFQAPRVIDYLSMRRMDLDPRLNIIINNKFPFDRYRFNVITIENPTVEIQNLLVTNGYIKFLDLKDLQKQQRPPPPPPPATEEEEEEEEVVLLFIHQSIQHTVDRNKLIKEVERLPTVNEGLPL